MSDVTNMVLGVLSKIDGGVNIEGKIEEMDFNKSQKMHLKFIKQQFLLSLLRDLDFDLNT